MSTFTASQLSELRADFARFETVDPCTPAYGKLISLLDALDDEALRGLAHARVKFVSRLALNRCIRRRVEA
jgi:hypothetical protein